MMGDYLLHWSDVYLMKCGCPFYGTPKCNGNPGMLKRRFVDEEKWNKENIGVEGHLTYEFRKNDCSNGNRAAFEELIQRRMNRLSKHS